MEPKRKGRPPKSNKGSATANLTMRLRPAVYEELRQAAEREGRSISAQAEKRLTSPEVNEIGRMISIAIDALDRQGGASWRIDPDKRLRARAILDFVGTLMLGPMPPQMGMDAVKKADAVFGNPPPTKSVLDLMLESHEHYDPDGAARWQAVATAIEADRDRFSDAFSAAVMKE